MIFTPDGGSGRMTDPSWEWRYDLFEIECGKNIWCTQIMGLLYAGFKLREFSERTSNECFIALHPMQEVVARLNVRRSDSRAPAVFQIAYDLTMAEKLAHELPSHGYQFGYAAGNDLAFVILNGRMEYDVFVLGFDAPHETRSRMAEWLAFEYPGVPIIALQSDSEPDIRLAHFRLELTGDRAFVPKIVKALNIRGCGG